MRFTLTVTLFVLFGVLGSEARAVMNPFGALKKANQGQPPKVLDLIKMPFQKLVAKSVTRSNTISKGLLGACGANQKACGDGCCHKLATCCHEPGTGVSQCCSSGMTCCSPGNGEAAYCYPSSTQRCCSGGPCDRSKSCCNSATCCSSGTTCCGSNSKCCYSSQHCCLKSDGTGTCCGMSKMCCPDGTCASQC